MQSLQYQILYQEIPAYAQEVNKASTLPELKAPTQKLFDRLMTLVFPDDTISIKPKANDPQVVEREKVKHASKLVEQVARECQAFEDDHQPYDVAYQ